MAKFHNITVKNVYKETKDCTVIEFDIPEDLQEDFNYSQGQHLTLKKDFKGEDVRRSYSLCSSPVDQQWQVAVKKIPTGKFSTFVNDELKAGDHLEVMVPSGKFGVEVASNESKNYIVFAAGSGITPIISMIKTHLKMEPESKFQLFYLNKNVKSIIFKEELEQLRNKYFGRLEIFYFLTREQRDIPMFNGRFDEEKIQQLTKSLIDVELVDECFICGPEKMIFLLRDELRKAGLSENKIHYELFVTGISEDDKKKAAQAIEHKFDGTQVTILDGGKEFHFGMTDDYDNVLDAALGAGADLPFACKGGVCSTCKCKVIEGSVEMKINYALEDDEVANKFVLSCQSVPTSEKLVVDFDV
ncbi:1,2-phenylacetyl-CoA epoxidase subunit PaaE [Mesonia aestuariivivens]|uniref:Phenylacetate-CoA oxygenase/reductase subunit PaaK n=1 Tax=Mesonia aestuariivivens TaxID=2796128 RepID=A0ABS6W5F8_9FLAO|nr:1,2-phenylacetyl-CoA epoxidase subunit PaaE [Mesonia aestuariivivens]MBW2962368.1 phenylacetate-CoA oxygenase/reductase subunit PaaK [Mesonia aestuariivivens]